MLVAEHLSKTYGSITALDDFSLTVQAGEIVGLIGHNGAGKTTFVEIVAGLVRPDSGRVEVTGIDIRQHPAQARARLGLAPQRLGLYPSVTVRQNLALFGGLAGLRRRALRQAIDEVSTATRLADILHRPVGLLSGGQQRRAQTASALLHRPAVLLLDEPTVGADPDTRQALLAVVRDRAATGTAVCYTTHYLPELADLDATLAIAATGRILARGDRSRLLADLAGDLRLGFAGPVPAGLLRPDRKAHGHELRIRTCTPDTDLAAVLAELATGTHPELVTVDIRRPGLDDLYHALREPGKEHHAD